MHDRSAPHLMTDWDHAEVREVDWGLGAAMLIRRSAIGQGAPFDERFFIYFEDVDLCLRLKQSGWKVVYFSGSGFAPLSPAGKRVGLVEQGEAGALEEPRQIHMQTPGTASPKGRDSSPKHCIFVLIVLLLFAELVPMA